MVQSQETHRPPLRSVVEAHITVTGATYTAKAGDRLVGVNRASAVTVTLPTAQLRSGRSYTVKDESGAASSNNITVATEGSETIDGSATDTIGDNYGSKTYYSDGSNWFTVPLLSVGSHSLASHSSEAHSELTGVGTDDHHAQSHTLDSHTGTLQHEKGGLEADVSAGDGLVEIKGGSTTVIKSKTDATAAPGVSNDTTEGYSVGSVWIDVTNDKAYVCLDITEGAAVWTEITVTGGGPTEATQSDLEDEGTTNADRYVSPEVARFHPGAVKQWCRIAGAGTLSSPSYNTASITDTGAGDRTVVIATDFSDADYYSSGQRHETPVGNTGQVGTLSLAVGSYQAVFVRHSDQTAVDQEGSTVACGDQ
jgi:hypothetical protein